MNARRAAKKLQLQKQYIERLLKERSEIWLEVGAGEKKGEGNWVTIDMTDVPDICSDLRNGLPFPDGSVSKIYSSHLFEHLSYKEIQIFLGECKRVLVTDGIFSICVPNARIYIEGYFKPEGLDKRRFLGYKEAFNDTTKIDCINYIAYMDGHHKYMFDEENLPHILKAKGFRNVRLRAFDPTLDLQARDYESIYAEAWK